MERRLLLVAVMRKTSLAALVGVSLAASSGLLLSIGCSTDGRLGKVAGNSTADGGAAVCPQPPSAPPTTSLEAVQTDAGGCTASACASQLDASTGASTVLEQQTGLCSGFVGDLAAQGQFVSANCAAAYQAKVALQQCAADAGSQDAGACSTVLENWDCYSAAITSAQNQEKSDEHNAGSVNRLCAATNALVANCLLDNCLSTNCSDSDASPVIDCCNTVSGLSNSDCCMNGTQQDVECDLDAGTVSQTAVTKCSSTCTVHGC